MKQRFGFAMLASAFMSSAPHERSRGVSIMHYARSV
jgi:hypothetical protein